MWCPEGYLPWQQVIDDLRDTVHQVLSRVAVGNELAPEHESDIEFIHTASFYLVKGGYAKNHKEADLIIWISTLYLIVQFFEKFPPFLASMDGSTITVDPIVFTHRDFFENWYYEWPLQQDPQYHSLFSYCAKEDFDVLSIFDRFAFINIDSGEICEKNGTRRFLTDTLGLDKRFLYVVEALIQRVKGFVICWKQFPSPEEYRSFLDCIAVNDSFSKALDKTVNSPKKVINGSKKASVGRPAKKDQIAKAYGRIFPMGHEAAGKTWKEAVIAVEEQVGQKVVEITLKRGVAASKQNAQNQ